jgi:hypothetical protein
MHSYQYEYYLVFFLSVLRLLALVQAGHWNVEGSPGCCSGQQQPQHAHAQLTT